MPRLPVAGFRRGDRGLPSTSRCGVGSPPGRVGLKRRTLMNVRAYEGPQDRLGRPLKDLRISVTDRCNFRCPYCMPGEVFGRDYPFLKRDQVLTFEEITRVARI